eukprot:s145_g37.t1
MKKTLTDGHPELAMAPIWRGSSIAGWIYVLLLRCADSAEPEAPSAHPKIPGFHNFRPELMLPDYDCHFLPESWWNMVTDFLGSLELVGVTGSARASGYETLEGELEIWNNYAEILADRPALAKDCPFANFMGRISLWTCCKIIEQLEKSRTPQARRASKGTPDYCEELRTDPVMLSRELLGSGEEHLGLRTSEHLVVFLNSRFSQHFHAWVKRSKDAFQFMRIFLEGDLDCQSAVDVPSEWDWPGYLERVSEEASNQEELEIEGAVIFAMNTRATKDMNQKLLECPLGMLAILAHQLEVGLGMLTEQISMGTYLMAFAVNLIETQLKSPDWLLLALLQSRWPVFTKLAASALLVQARNSWLSPPRYQNKPYKLDFLPSELLYPLDERHQLPHGTTSAALTLRRNAWRRSESYAQLMRALQTSLENAPALRGRHVVMFTLVYGARYAGYLPRWIQRAVAFGHGARTLLFCLDENTVKVHLELRIRGLILLDQARCVLGSAGPRTISGQNWRLDTASVGAMVDLFMVSRNLVRLGRNADYREQFGLPCEAADGGVNFLLEDLYRYWAAGMNLRTDDLKHAIQKFMYHENQEMRFQLFESHLGLTVFVANSRHKGKGKGFGFKGKGKGKGPLGYCRARGMRTCNTHCKTLVLIDFPAQGDFQALAILRGSRRDVRDVREQRPGREHRDPRSRSGSRRRSRSPTGQVMEKTPTGVKKPPPPVQGKGGDGWEMFSIEGSSDLWYDHPGFGDGCRWVCFEDKGKLGEVQAYQNTPDAGARE